jgi:hypothetical protein
MYRVGEETHSMHMHAFEEDAGQRNVGRGGSGKINFHLLCVQTSLAPGASPFESTLMAGGLAMAPWLWRADLERLLHSGACSCQCCLWQAALQYAGPLHLEHSNSAGFSHMVHGPSLSSSLACASLAALACVCVCVCVCACEKKKKTSEHAPRHCLHLSHHRQLTRVALT